MRRYNPKELEPKWQKIWQDSGVYKASEDAAKPKRYVLEYFPYPSGAAMHVGHVRNYTIGDAVARFGRMNGHNVLHPMGWDAFGLPAENYAIKSGITPQKAVAENVARFKHQLMQMGLSYDWTREINSTDPAYYKWTQWFFLLLHKKGLAYQKESLQWWCPHDKTVLANEQVEHGLCWRCGHEVEKKSLRQWFFKITDYADRLDKDLAKLDWSDAIKAMQHNWIGRSVGAEIDFELESSKEKIKVFTTRPDTIFGATFLVLSPEHTILNKLSTSKDIKDYIKKVEAKTEIDRMETQREKTGVFTDSYAINPLTKEKIPIWVADYVLPSYGTGAIMAVPAHDERDWQFAKAFNLPIKQVVAKLLSGVNEVEFRPGEKVIERNVAQCIVWHPTKNQIIVLEVPAYKWRTLVMGGVDEGEDWVEGAKREIYEETGYKNLEFIDYAGQELWSEFWALHKKENRIAHFRGMQFKLKDLEQNSLSSEESKKHVIHWQDPLEAAEQFKISEPRYFVQSALAGDDFKPFTGEGKLINSGKYTGMDSAEARDKIIAGLADAQEKVNYKMHDWLISRQRYWGAPIPIIHCPKCGVVPVPEEDLPVVLPEVKSYEPSGDGRSPLANVPEFVNVDCPKCGGKGQRETDTMDGFACSSWYFLRFADPHNTKAAFDKKKADFWLPVDDYIGGAEHAVLHLLYARFWTKVMYDEKLINFDEPFTSLRNHGMILAPDGAKMSKSKGNTIEPDVLLGQGYGADSIRLMELFIGPWNQAASWSVEGMGGTYRFLQRVWTLVGDYQESSGSETNIEETALAVLSHKTIKKVTEDIHRLDFNTAIAALMSMVNELYKLKAQKIAKTPAWQQAIETLLLLLAPFAPHISEELWHDLGHETSIHVAPWPTWDEQLIQEDTMTLAVQINGKVRAEIEVATDISEEDAITEAKNAATEHLPGKNIKKAIYVPGRLVSLVI